jgi:hypothetical protein
MKRFPDGTYRQLKRYLVECSWSAPPLLDFTCLLGGFLLLLTPIKVLVSFYTLARRKP